MHVTVHIMITKEWVGWCEVSVGCRFGERTAEGCVRGRMRAAKEPTKEGDEETKSIDS